MELKLRKLLASVKPITEIEELAALFDGSVTFIDAKRVYVSKNTSGNITIGFGTIVFPDVYLLGTVKIGRDCIIWPNRVIWGKESGVIIGDGVELGRPALIDSEIGERSRLGAFTEIVRSKLGPDTAAQHWCYIGDTQSGQGVNFGAGTVTANYDGEKKNKTVIGDYVFTGILSSLVAPLTIGREALIGAGAVITQDVPPHAVVIGHNRVLEDTTFHKTKTGWKIRKVKGK